MKGLASMTGRLTSAERHHYRAQGWMARTALLPDALLAPLRAAAQRLVEEPPWPELLSGIHNPFGYHACADEAWQFLDLAESADILDAVEDVLGPDLVLWDSELYLASRDFSAVEAAYWPVEPLAGAVTLVVLDEARLVLADIRRLDAVRGTLPLGTGPLYALRYMPATCRFNRDPRFPPNRRATELRPLINYAQRPIWLLRGEDRAGSDFAAGFSAPVAQWASGAQSGALSGGGGVRDGDRKED